ncbi:MAG: phosphonate ABC transporter, permease protein PhnE, partial [Alphaproteobacteria bacterium]|nr:phosphonate ABC transporter, permease protein PhnE [Alphaproteobacteria bacterium]
MPLIETKDGPDWRRRTTKKELLHWLGWLLGTSVVVYAWELISAKTIWFFVEDAGQQAMDIGSRMIPPKLYYMEKLWWPIWDTINIATIGTV